MNRFLKIVWSVNGVLLLLIFLFSAVFIAGQLLDDLWRRTQSPEVIVGKELEDAKQKGLILQGLTYEEPLPILHSDFFLLPVSITTFETPKTRSKMLRLSSGESGIAEMTDLVNIIFLNEELEAERVLVDKKAFILSFRFPGEQRTHPYHADVTDTLQRHITYLIGFDDTNNDGTINSLDNQDLYVSNLDGSELTRISSNVDIVDYYFLNPDNIVVRYTKREKMEEEHKKIYFAQYNIRKKELKDLTSLHNTLDKIDQLINR